ncbi:MAG TPA: radical SAM protein [Syntrophales bacterium]|nr:radical SAM protein [Syntrophales bacterium]
MPMLDWIQVEITSRCNASCLYCPRTAYRDHWPGRDLSRNLTEALAPYFATTGMVHLQGWGEPLLHGGFFEMIGLAKKAGCRVTTATNGMLLDRKMAARLVASGIDDVAFSLAAIGEGNDEIRRGTSFAAVLAAIDSIASAKKERCSATPVVGIAYMLLRSQASSLPEIVPALANRGIENIIISTLDFVPSRSLKSEQILPKNEAEYQEWKSKLDRLVDEGKRTGLTVHYHLARPGRSNRTCTENIGRTLVVAADGGVSPCVFTNIPASRATQPVEVREKTWQRLSFGNLSDESLSSIWRSEPYASFRRSLRKTPHPRCRSCLKLIMD